MIHLSLCISCLFPAAAAEPDSRSRRRLVAQTLQEAVTAWWIWLSHLAKQPFASPQSQRTAFYSDTQAVFCFVLFFAEAIMFFKSVFFTPMLWFAVQMLHFVQRKQLWGARGSSPGILRDFFSLCLSLSLFLFLFCITSLTLHIELTPLDRFGVVKEYDS